MTYTLPAPASRPAAAPNTAYLIASGDLRESANVAGWPTQVELEAGVTAVLAGLGWQVVRANDVDPVTGHGFISSQRMGLEIFKSIPTDAPLIVAEAVWQYSHHVLAGLRTHQGPILTVANFAGDWPGLVGLLGLNAGLTKMGKDYATIWSVDFSDDWFRDGIREWTESGRITHDASHVRPLPVLPDSPEVELGRALGDQLLADKAIIGVFDEGCMGMYNAIFDDELLNRTGIYKERLSQSALYAEMLNVTDAEADAAYDWLTGRGMRFLYGDDATTELTREQVQWQLKMYIAALRIADDFGLDAVGIQYQQGLKDLVPASDLAEGILNSTERPPVLSRDGSRELHAGRAFPHFNEADEGVAVDALVTDRVWTAMGLVPDNTLHDVRWGEQFGDDFVWVYEISGSVPASHLGGWDKAEGWRQGHVFFPAGGATINGVSKPGEIVLSRVFIADGILQADIFRATIVELPAEETQRRKDATNPEWPIAHVVLHGVSRDQFMARHKANHAQLVYAPDADTADRALVAKAAMFDRIGIRVNLVGDVAL
ncbi:MAG: fucose isomerase [Microbacterium sp. SCN 70-200]|uniref:fucose isomerase n=1 Tax=unclassified Microbacterium TaxID=2609290 RepID=UPI00086D6BA3|nr:MULTISPECIES: fucose isomerase [unclassified Microbacterium]MBN9214930.1 fucose isomerase [Microbacterium sp.]ODT42970.1 MAG: fucose isomerase [Microbacterium sp. SCN 70-200]OJV84724.1 MAG: fucose isomerase [Microbacterium sp. 70-16]